MCFLNLSIRQNSCLKIRRSCLHTLNTFHINEIKVLYKQVATILLPTQNNKCRSNKQKRLLRKSNMGRQIESQGTMTKLSPICIPFPNVGRSCSVPLFTRKNEHKIDLRMLMSQKELSPIPSLCNLFRNCCIVHFLTPSCILGIKFFIFLDEKYTEICH